MLNCLLHSVNSNGNNLGTAINTINTKTCKNTEGCKKIRIKPEREYNTEVILMSESLSGCSIFLH